MLTVRYKFDPAKPAALTPDQQMRLRTMTEAEIEDNARNDADNPPMTEAEIATGYRPGDIRDLRQRLHLSQAGFARSFGINLRTLQEWEQGRRAPDQIAKSYLRVIGVDPEAVVRALAAE